MRDVRADRRRVRRAAIVEESVLQRTRAAQLLVERNGMEVVHSGGSLRAFLAWLERTDRTRWPHVLVLDLPAEGDASGDLDIMVALRAAGMRILVLSSLRPRAVARRLLEIKVDGIVSTGDSEEDLLVAVDAVLAGESTVTPRAAAMLRGPDDAPRLSSQEERVLALYTAGLTISEVADRIGVRHDTARKYLTRVRDKFTAAGRPARSKLELARIAWAEGYAADVEQTVPPRAQREPENTDRMRT
ncbi:hypothetical protein [Streptomyces sp. AC495_CC817]|uniref:hypothetical protein n=1 Tax=Streptomyces sp. AC495_CC817 TaxID=2823900 RepID=UPI001C280829|nr:hypothetical protein [Streptomyces sp. AC495_CC817]